MTSRVAIQFGDGRVMSSWIRYQLRDTYTDPLASLQFVARPPRDQIAEYRERTAKGSLFTLKVDGVSQGGFLVETQTISVGRDGVTIELDCKSPLITPYQGGVNPDLAISKAADSPLTDIVLAALTMYGFEQIAGDSAASVNALTGKRIDGRKQSLVVEELKAKDAAAQVGESAYSFASRMFARLGVCLRMAADGTLLLGAPDYEQAPAYGVGCTFGSQLEPWMDRMLDGVTVRATNDDQFSECIVRGERPDSEGEAGSGRPIARVTTRTAEAYRPKGAPFGNVAPTFIDEGRYVYDTAMPAAMYKPLFIDDRKARDVQRCTNVAKLALGLRHKSAYSVSCTVEGHTARTGRIWTVDTVAKVVVEQADLNEEMWLSSRTLTGDESGQRTELEFLPKHALVLGDVPN